MDWRNLFICAKIKLKFMKTKILLLGAIILFAFQSKAQLKYIGVFGGVAYFPAVNQSIMPDMGFIYSDYVDKKLSIRLQGNLSSADNNGFWDLKGMAEYNFFRFSNSRFSKKYTPYAALGLGIADLPEEVAGYNLILPATLGVKFKLGRSAIFGVETSFNYSNTTFLSGQNRQTTINWYALAGAYLAFNFYKPDMPCPAYR